jgi:hypothetical protein
MLSCRICRPCRCRPDMHNSGNQDSTGADHRCPAATHTLLRVMTHRNLYSVSLRSQRAFLPAVHRALRRLRGCCGRAASAERMSDASGNSSAVRVLSRGRMKLSRRAAVRRGVFRSAGVILKSVQRKACSRTRQRMYAMLNDELLLSASELKTIQIRGAAVTLRGEGEPPAPGREHALRSPPCAPRGAVRVVHAVHV